ncbi:MAG: hypothetical protein ACP5N1_03705 [Candidatus Woesearchaeota archaeon]
MNPWKLAIIGGMLAYSCSTKTPEPFANQKELEQDSLEMMLQPDTCNQNPIRIITKEDSIKEIFLQKSFSKLYAEGSDSSRYGFRLYTNEELLCDSFKPEDLPLSPSVRVFHYFLRNGREATFEAAEELGAKYHQTKIDENHSLTSLFEEAGISLKDKIIDWIEVPESRSGSLEREKKYFLGKTEIILSVNAPSKKLDPMDQAPAKAAGYAVNPKADFNRVVVHEQFHEIQDKYFNGLLDKSNRKKISEPFASFKSEIPGLRFYNNIQAGEFLSIVADWSENQDEGVNMRFFNSLLHMSPDAYFGTGLPDGEYAYAYRVQEYAMVQVLKNKGYNNSREIVDALISIAKEVDYKTYNNLFVLTRHFFKEEDFKEIAKIYRRIGVDLLKTMQPYFKEQ